VTPWTLAQVNDVCRSAPAVYLALCELAGDNNVLFPTREAIAKCAGVKKDRTVSDALGVLHEAGWIERQRVRQCKGGRWTCALRIIIRKGRKTALSERARKGRKTAFVDRAEKRPFTLPTEEGEHAASLRGGYSPEQQQYPLIPDPLLDAARARRLAAQQEQAK
jgi:hypothetical protein